MSTVTAGATHSTIRSPLARSVSFSRQAPPVKLMSISGPAQGGSTRHWQAVKSEESAWAPRLAEEGAPTMVAGLDSDSLT